MTLLGGRSAVVTGAGDIGVAIAERLRTHGAAVEVWDVADDALANVRSDGFPGRVVDVSQVDAVDAATEAAWSEHGPIEILVNSAAIARFGSVTDLEVAEWRATLDVNLTGVYLVCRAFVPRMADTGGGSIVNISSVGGLRGEPEFTSYCASKFGVIGFSQSLAREVGPLGIRVNTVCPGAVESRMNTETMERDARLTGTTVAEVERRILARTSLRRLVLPEDVGDAVVFLASDLASCVTAESLAVTGGVF